MGGLPKSRANYQERNTRGVQVTYAHAYVGKNSLGGTVTAFALAGFLKAPTVVMINAERAFAGSVSNIHHPTTKVLLHAAFRDLSKSKKLHDWAVLNALLLLIFLAKAVVIRVDKASGELLNTFSAKIMEHGLESKTEEFENDSAAGQKRSTPRT